MTRNEIFVSYSHRDRPWLDELLITLKPLTRKRRISVWEDTKIQVGGRWRTEIAAALGRARIAVLLVSRYFLHSEFITEHELAPLLDSAEKEGLTIIWIAVGHSLYEETEIVEFQAANDPSRPLNSLSVSDADLELVRIAKAIDRVLEPESEPIEEKPKSETSVSEFRRNRTKPGGASPPKPPGIGQENAIRERLHRVLAEGEWAWRSVERLAAKAAITREEALRALRADPEIELSKSKSGRTIAGLRARVRG